MYISKDRQRQQEPGRGYLAVGAGEADGADAAVRVEQVDALAAVATGPRRAVVDVERARAARVAGRARAVEVVHEVDAGGAVEALAGAVVHVGLAVAAGPAGQAGARVAARRVVARRCIHARTQRTFGPTVRCLYPPLFTLIHICKQINNLCFTEIHHVTTHMPSRI